VLWRHRAQGLDGNFDGAGMPLRSVPGMEDEGAKAAAGGAIRPRSLLRQDSIMQVCWKGRVVVRHRHPRCRLSPPLEVGRKALLLRVPTPGNI
jgi:hypothetical protein